MKIFQIGLCLVIAVATLPLPAQDKEKDGEKEKEVDPNELFKDNFDELEGADLPSDWLALEGEWDIAEEDGSKVVQLSPNPLVEASVQMGKSVRDEGATAIVRVKADRKRRNAPRFGIGLHGGNGFHFRVVPLRKQVELKRGDDIVQSTEFEWRPGEWHFLKLTVVPAADAWTVSAKIWAESDDEPKDNQLEYIATDIDRLSGKVSLLATPYAGLPIYFDDLEARKIEE
ncbi:MAG: hypothetical protein HKN23_02665 [Verrucomicrobiales bacterium]|nr:hypothetical protein [Verrucomicrobiales bacterium]